MNNTTVETITGAAVILVAGLFLFFAQQTVGWGKQTSGYALTAEFDNVEGINVGTDIRLAGIKVGTVTDQKLNPENYQAVVTMVIDPKIQLTEDTSAKVTSEGLLGSKFIALEPGGSEVKLADGGFITATQGAVDIWSLISQAMFEKSKSGESKSSAEPHSLPPEAAPPPDTGDDPSDTATVPGSHAAP